MKWRGSHLLAPLALRAQAFTWLAFFKGVEPISRSRLSKRPLNPKRRKLNKTLTDLYFKSNAKRCQMRSISMNFLEIYFSSGYSFIHLG